MTLGPGSNSDGQRGNVTGGGQRVNSAVAAANAANAALLARRGSYPLNAVAALTAAQQRNLNITSSGLTGSTNPLVSVSVAGGSSAAAQAGQQQHNSLTAVAAAAQLHGLTP